MLVSMTTIFSLVEELGAFHSVNIKIYEFELF